jgi:hypothetical protein
MPTTSSSGRLAEEDRGSIERNQMALIERLAALGARPIAVETLPPTPSTMSCLPRSSNGCSGARLKIQQRLSAGQRVRAVRDDLRRRGVTRRWGRWRPFFMACAELFASPGGSEWMVSHYTFRP